MADKRTTAQGVLDRLRMFSKKIHSETHSEFPEFSPQRESGQLSKFLLIVRTLLSKIPILNAMLACSS